MTFSFHCRDTLEIISSLIKKEQSLNQNSISFYKRYQSFSSVRRPRNNPISFVNLTEYDNNQIQLDNDKNQDFILKPEEIQYDFEEKPIKWGEGFALSISNIEEISSWKRARPTRTNSNNL